MGQPHSVHTLKFSTSKFPKFWILLSNSVDWDQWVLRNIWRIVQQVALAIINIRSCLCFERERFGDTQSLLGVRRVENWAPCWWGIENFLFTWEISHYHLNVSPSIGNKWEAITKVMINAFVHTAKNIHQGVKDRLLTNPRSSVHCQS